MTTTADYRDRRADVLAFRGVFPQLAGGRSGQVLAQELVRPGDGGALVAGIEKLAQKVLLILLTKTGSRKYAAAEGTAFMIDAARGWWRTPADVEQSFYAARLDVARQCRASEADADPPDERWGALDLSGVAVSAGAVTLRLTLTSAAGSAYTFLAPVTVPLK